MGEAEAIIKNFTTSKMNKFEKKGNDTTIVSLLHTHTRERERERDVKFKNQMSVCNFN